MIEVTLAAEAWKDVTPGVEALLDRWQVGEGGVVRAGQVLAQAVLVKATLDILAPADGHIEKIVVPAGVTFAQGQAIALLKEAP